MPVTNDPIRSVYNRWDRFLNDAAKVIGQDRELGELSNKMDALRGEVFADGVVSPQELEQLHGKMELIAQAYAQIAKDRGYPLDQTLPTTKKSFEVYGEGAQIHFQTLAGKDIANGKVGGLLKDLHRQLAGQPLKLAPDQTLTQSDAAKTARTIAMDIATSATSEVAAGKVSLLRGELSRLTDAKAQNAALATVRKELEALGRAGNAGAKAISLERFDQVARFNSAVSVHKVNLPDSVKGTNQLFPNKPVPGWEAEVRQATKAGFDDLSRAGKLFVDDDVKFPPGTTKTVAVKLDLNLGREGTPSVSDPASTAATISELLERSSAKGKTVHLTVGDSSGGENIPLGRTSMDITKDTGSYHMALKAGLQFAAQQGSAAAGTALAKIEAVEASGVYFGSKDDKSSTPADLAAAESAAKPYVSVIDYDVEGFVPVTPDLPVHGTALWGTKEFHIAKPWVEADFRVHVARGLSTHTLAEWTGAQKGLIGLHGFGLRPADQSGDKIGQDPIDLFKLLGGATGFLAMFARRQGMPSALKALFDHGEGLTHKQKWEQLMADPAAGKYFRDETEKLADELKADKAGGMHEVQIFDKMRARTRVILEEADKRSPGFKQHLWNEAHEATRFAMQNFTREPIRQVIPEQSRDEAIGSRIALLTVLPYQSDLVVQSQAKIGIGGGPDAYRDVRDVGHVAVGTHEAAIDALAWEAAHQPGDKWATNWPALWGTRLGNGPMNSDEITRL